MQSQANRDVVKNITTAAQLEGELQISEAQHGVAVLDVYNAEWGHCKALSDTFRRLFTDAGDVIHLRFFSVECNAVLESLNNLDEAKAHRPQHKGMVFSKDTLASFWTEMLKGRQNHSKPFFAFYKEGKMRTKLEGIDTPKICRIVYDLCKPQNAASEYITNDDALNFWNLYFSPLESEVSVNDFVRAVQGLLGDSASQLSEQDFIDVTAEVQGGVSGTTVTAANLQSFVGDRKTVQDAISTVVAGKLTSIRKAEAAPPQTEEGEPQTEEGEHQTEEGEHQTEEGEHQTEEGEHQTEEGEHQTGEGEPQTEEGEHQTEEGEPQTEEGEHQTEEGEHQTEEGEPQTEEGEPQTEEGEHQTEEGEPQTEEGEHQTEEGEHQTEEGEHQTEEGEPQTEEGEHQTEEGEPQTEEGEHQTEEGEPQTEEGEPQTEEGEQQTGKPEEKVADEGSVVQPPTVDAAEAGAGEAGTDTHENDESAEANPGEAQAPAAVESPVSSPSLPGQGHDVRGVEEDSGTPADEPYRKDDMETSPGMAESHSQHKKLPEDAYTPSLPPPPPMNTTEPGGNSDGKFDEAESSAPPADTVGQEESVENQIFTNRWVTVTEEEMRMWNMVAALPLHYPESTALMVDLTNNVALVQEALSGAADLPTLAEYLAAQGVSFTDINMMCIAADQKVGSESLSYGKLSLILMSCDPVEGRGLVPQCETFLGELSDGTILKHHQPIAFTALTLSASDAYPEECFCYCVPETAAAAFEELAVDDVFILNALTPLRTAVSQNEQFVLRIIGLPKVIELATTDASEETVVLSQWYAQMRVTEQSAGAVTAHFVENVCDDEFQAFLSGYTARLVEDEKRLDRKHDDDTQAAEGMSEDEELGDGKRTEGPTPEPADVL
ncbi:hypothetical protein JKF63_00312 [Porcisia hertigi]|uniref:Uncharacterized protein n=1 Tax=Porcisia hertigi TaxID=2761500 RepID=A0A836L6R3_9TRYP|nr:hypothetical protein JKF63_00312 [Porcisia hertigi]